MNLRNYVLFLLLAFVCANSPAVTVNRLNGGANVIYVDFSLNSTSIPLELIRSYSSITAANETSGWLGAFGWGWTSAFETTLNITPERNVILRDGMTGNTLVFKPVKEDPKLRETFLKSVKAKYFESKKGRALTEKELDKEKLPSKMLSRLKSDPSYRVEVAGKYGVTASIPKSELLISSEYGYQTIQFKNNTWIVW